MGQVATPGAGGTVTGSPLRAPTFYNFAKDVIDRWAAERPDAPALWHVTAPDGREQRFSFRDISLLSSKAAAFLAACGVRPGDRVLLMLPRIPQWWIAMLGLIRLGAVPVPATLLLTKRDVEFRLRQAGVTAAITSPDGVEKLDGFEGCRILAAATQEGWLSFDDGVKRAEAYEGEQTRGDAPGILFFTSATTGNPKMVLHTQTSYGLGHRLTGGIWLDLKPTDVHWNISDLGWGKAAWSSLYGPWLMGACVFALDAPGKFDPRLTLHTLETFPVTTWCAPPTALRLIVKENLSSLRFPALRHCVTAGEPLNPEVFNLWKESTGLSLYEAYGQSETVVLVANAPGFGLPIRTGWMGVPVPGMNVRLVNEDFQEVPPGCEGEIALKISPERPVGLFKEYWQSPEETSRVFQKGVYLTGDRALKDDAGYFKFIGRKDDVIKSSGYRIGPFEVESALIEHPSVLDVAVVGKPDALRGQVVKAFVVLRRGVSPTDSLKRELQAHCKALIAAYKYPREVEFVEDLPKTTSGKTRRVALRAQATSLPPS